MAGGEVRGGWEGQGLRGKMGERGLAARVAELKGTKREEPGGPFGREPARASRQRVRSAGCYSGYSSMPATPQPVRPEDSRARSLQCLCNGQWVSIFGSRPPAHGIGENVAEAGGPWRDGRHRAPVADWPGLGAAREGGLTPAATAPARAFLRWPSIGLCRALPLLPPAYTRLLPPLSN